MTTSHHGHMDAVELVEGTDIEPWADEPDGGSPGRVRGMARAWPLVAVVALVACAYAVQGSRERAELAARQTALHDERDYVAGLGTEPRLAWSTAGVADLYSAEVAGDTVLVRAAPLGSSTGEVAIDLRTGEHRWYLPKRPDVRELCGGGDTGALECVAVFYVTTSGSRYSKEVELAELRDAATGKVVASRDVVDHVAAVAWDGDLLLLDADGEGLDLSRESYDGEVRWAVPVLDRPLRSGERARLRVEAATALVTVGSRVVAVDAVGAVVPDPTHRLELERLGRPLVLGADDGSVLGAVVLGTAGGLEVRDRATATLLLALDGSVPRNAYVLDGALVAIRDGVVEATSVHTGVRRWAVELTRGLLVGTDGRHVLVLDQLGHERELRAFDVGTGREVWHRLLAEPGAWPRAVGGALLVHAGDTLSRWAS